MISEQKITDVLTADAKPIEAPADLLARIKQEMAVQQPAPQRRTTWWTRRSLQRLLAGVAVAAAVVTLAVLAPWPGSAPSNVIAAMEQAVATLHSYHGVLADGTEVWHEGNKFAIRYPDGRVAVNNGEQLWEQDAAERKVYISAGMSGNTGYNVADIDLPFIVGLARERLNTIEGQEMVAGRKATRVLVTIQEGKGLSYSIWIDNETDLPLQWEQWEGSPPAYHLKTFTTFEVNPQVDPAVFAYQVPAGYETVERGGQEQRVQTVEQAAAIAGVTPLLPKDPPQRMWASPLGYVVLAYGDVRVLELKIQEPLEMDGQSAYGTAAGGPLEVKFMGDLRWQQAGVEIEVQAQPQAAGRRLELARQIAPDLTLPKVAADLVGAAQVKVHVDPAQARALQQRADAAATRADMRLRSQADARNYTFLWGDSQGVQFKPTDDKDPIVRVVANNGFQAVINVNQGPYKRVYMQRVARQDYMGLWFVVGYDPR